jgi:pimeloyl-[acyl-carrier protein] methyl ester esterase
MFDLAALLQQEGLTVVCLPLPGYETTSPAFGWSPASACERLASRLPAGECILLGWSLGGNLAMQLASTPPEPVSARQAGREGIAIKGVITLASNPVFVARENWDTGISAQRFAQFQSGLCRDREKTLKQFRLLCCQGSPDFRGRARWLERQQQDMPAVLPENLAGSLSLLAEDQRAVWQACPVAAMHLLGQADALVPAGLRERLCRLVPGQGVEVVPDSSHLLFADQLQRVAKAIMQFIYSLS